MEITTELQVTIDEASLQRLRDLLPSEYSVQQVRAPDRFVVECRHPTKQTKIDLAVCEFLESLSGYEDAIKHGSALLRVGVFFDVEEAAFFSVELSRQTVALLARFGLAIDIAGYPCA